MSYPISTKEFSHLRERKHFNYQTGCLCASFNFWYHEHLNVAHSNSIIIKFYISLQQIVEIRIFYSLYSKLLKKNISFSSVNSKGKEFLFTSDEKKYCHMKCIIFQNLFYMLFEFMTVWKFKMESTYLEMFLYKSMFFCSSSLPICKFCSWSSLSVDIHSGYKLDFLTPNK